MLTPGGLRKTRSAAPRTLRSSTTATNISSCIISMILVRDRVPNPCTSRARPPGPCCASYRTPRRRGFNHELQPVLVLRFLSGRGVEKRLLDSLRNRSAHARADLPAVYLNDRSHLGGGPGEESFVGGEQVLDA